MRETFKNKLLVALLIVAMLFTLIPFSVFATGEATNEASVPEDFQNDIWLQYDHKALNVGEEARIFPRRVEQIIDGATTNNVTRPEFNFEIIQGDSISLDTEKSNGAATVTANKAGTAIVKVTYNAVEANGKTYGKTSEINAGYIVYTVGETGTATPVIGDNLDKLTSYDTIYFSEGNSVPLTFTATAEGASTLAVTCNGTVVQAGEGNTYTVPLENRSNIIGVVATDSDGNTKSYYKVVDARKIEIIIKNISYPGYAPAAGDTINVSFKGITMPIYKLAQIYNPCYTFSSPLYPEQNTDAAYVSYQYGESQTAKGICDQWDLATNNDFNVTFDKAGTYGFTGGSIKGDVYAQKIGDDKTSDLTGGTNPGTIYPILHYAYSSLPDFKIDVQAETSAKKVESISMGQESITLYKGDVLTYEEMAKKVGGVVVTPDDATNKGYTWESSNQFTLNTKTGVFKAQNATETNELVTLTVKTTDGNKTATCKVSILEPPATDPQKKALISKIAEAKKVVFVKGTDKEWSVFQGVIKKQEELLKKSGLLGIETTNAIGQLNSAIKSYEKAVNNVTIFKHTVKSEKVDGGTKVTVYFENLTANLYNENDTTSLKLVYATDIPKTSQITSEEAWTDKEKLKTLSFIVPTGTSGTFNLTDGYIQQEYVEMGHPWQPPTSGTNYYFEDQMPEIALKITENGSITPSTPENKEKVSISIDKLTIGGGMVIDTTSEALKTGDTAWDITKRVLDSKGIKYEFSYSSKYGSVYVSSIDGVGEFDNGPGSGWMYSVNGVYPDKGCDKYSLKNGDQIKWRYTTNLGADIGGGVSDTTDKPANEEGTSISDNKVTATIDAVGKPDVNGKTQITVSSDTLSKSLASVVEAAKKAEADGKKDVKMAIDINAKADGNIKSINISLPTDPLKSITNHNKTEVKLRTSMGDITIDNNTLKEILNKSSGGSIQFSIAKPDTSKMTAEQKDKMEELSDGRPTLDISITSGNNIIDTFGSGKIIISVPYSPKAGEKTENLVIYYIDDKGIAAAMETTYNEKNKTLLFNTNHFSIYVVGYKKDNNTEDSIKALKNLTLRLSSSKVKKGIKIKWQGGNSKHVDGYEVFRSTQRNKGYTNTAIYKTSNNAKNTYLNTKNLKNGTRYYYKVRGYKVIDGKNYYSNWSSKAYRTV